MPAPVKCNGTSGERSRTGCWCTGGGTPVCVKDRTPPICASAAPVRRQDNAEAGSAVTCAALAAV